MQKQTFGALLKGLPFWLYLVIALFLAGLLFWLFKSAENFSIDLGVASANLE
jgi:type III secretory pathway component EscV